MEHKRSLYSAANILAIGYRGPNIVGTSINICSGLNVGPTTGKILGKGSFGEVRLCSDRASKQVFACKQLAQDNLKAVDAAKLEFAKIVGLANPHLIRYYHFDPVRMQLFMEYVLLMLPIFVCTESRA